MTFASRGARENFPICRDICLIFDRFPLYSYQPISAPDVCVPFMVPLLLSPQVIEKTSVRVAKNLFGDDQLSSLADMIQASLMLNENHGH